METYHHSRVVVPHATTTSVKIDISCSPHLNPPRILHCSRRRISRLTSLGAVYGTRAGTNKKGRRESSLSLSESVDMRTHVGVVKSSALAGKIFRRFLKDGKFSLFDDAKRRTRIPGKLCERQRKRERKVWRPPPSSFFWEVVVAPKVMPEFITPGVDPGAGGTRFATLCTSRFAGFLRPSGRFSAVRAHFLESRLCIELRW